MTTGARPEITSSIIIPRLYTSDTELTFPTSGSVYLQHHVTRTSPARSAPGWCDKRRNCQPPPPPPSLPPKPHTDRTQTCALAHRHARRRMHVRTQCSPCMHTQPNPRARENKPTHALTHTCARAHATHTRGCTQPRNRTQAGAYAIACTTHDYVALTPMQRRRCRAAES